MPYPDELDALDEINPTSGATSQTGHAAKHREIAESINRTQETLGLNPEGSYPTVSERLGSFVSGGIRYQYDSDTSASAPALGYLKFNNSSLISATQFLIRELNYDGDSIAGLLDVLDDSTSSVKCRFLIVKEGDPNVWIEFGITSVFTDNGTYRTATISVSGVGTNSWTDNDFVRVFYSVSGNTGATGAAALRPMYSWFWVGEAITDPEALFPSVGDWGTDTADIQEATKMYLSNGSNEGDPNALFLYYAKNGYSGRVWLCGSGGAEWVIYRITKVIEHTSYYEFDVDVEDAQEAIEVSERCFFLFSWDRDTLQETYPYTGFGGGITMFKTAGESLAFGDLVYLKSDGKAWKADFNATTTMPAVCMALGSISADAIGEFLVQGTARHDTWNWTIGGILYVSTGGAMTHTAPSGSGDVVQAVAVCHPNADTIILNPGFNYRVIP